MLGVSERTFRRWRDRLGDEGLEGLRDRRIGKPSSRQAAAEEIRRMLGLYQERDEGVPVKYFHSSGRSGTIASSATRVTRLALQGSGVMRPAPRRSAYRKKRPRRPMVGMMLSPPSRKRETPRASPGCWAMTGNPIWWSSSRMRPARSIRV